MYKILILGSQGMLGHVLYNYLKSTSKYSIFGLARREGAFCDIECDVKNIDKLKGILKDNSFDIVINCIGVLVKESEEHKANAVMLNSYLPNLLSEYSNELNYNFVHVSTDCVFSGDKGNYSVNENPDGKDVYAKTKILGELIKDNSLVLRTSIIGPELKQGTGLMEWFFSQSGTVNGYVNAFWSGVTTLELSKVINSFLQKEITRGLYQIAPEIKINKYDLLELIKEVFGLRVKVTPYDNYKIDKSLIPSFPNDLSAPSYLDMLKNLKAYMLSNKHLYIPRYINE